MARYGQSFNSRTVARLLPPESAVLNEVAREIGVGAGTLERWRGVARFDAALTTAIMDEDSKGDWCRANGVYPHDLAFWRPRTILSGFRQPSVRRRSNSISASPGRWGDARAALETLNMSAGCESCFGKQSN